MNKFTEVAIKVIKRERIVYKIMMDTACGSDSLKFDLKVPFAEIIVPTKRTISRMT